MKYTFYGDIKISVDNVEVEAENESDAFNKAQLLLADNYHLNVHGYNHSVENGINYDLNLYAVDDSEDEIPNWTRNLQHYPPPLNKGGRKMK